MANDAGTRRHADAEKGLRWGPPRCPAARALAASLLLALVGVLPGLLLVAALGSDAGSAGVSASGRPPLSASSAPGSGPDSEHRAAQSSEAPESLLHWLGRNLGPRYAVIFLFLTVNLVALMIMNALGVWRESVLPPALVRAVEADVEQRQYREARRRIQRDPSLLGRVLAAGLARLPAGPQAARAALEESGAYEGLKLEQRLGYVGLIAKLAPLFGLLGVVDGMATTFDLIAQRDMMPRPAELAAGVGTALVAMIVGLWIAIVAIAFCHVVRNRTNRLLAEVGIVSEDLLERLAPGDGAGNRD
ncbi:MAG: MotA/TolQ/ExbB proton channel family protein [Thermoguttaceae bacterium]